MEFKLNYLELADSTDVIGTEIISYARNTEEVIFKYYGQKTLTLGYRLFIANSDSTVLSLTLTLMGFDY